MLAQRCVVDSPVHLRWVWPALVDVDNIATWSGFDRCLGDEQGMLHPASELSCTLAIGDQTVGATLSVVESVEPTLLKLRTEAGIATVFETIGLEATGSGTRLSYELDVHSPLLRGALEPWIAEHVGIVHGGLQEFLSGTGECWSGRV
ncbi:SRPBCC family protein [Solicola sp. PLA-1-18]|uniref:SRPBCC family protein n=1 Tax=Solicola sp. PLA-1-18 TaxID=3380532 RepID=UPI003B767A6D